MPKVYDVVLPAHSGGGRFEVVSPNESHVKRLICSSLKKDRVPKGTTIQKIGLSKGSISSSLVNKTTPKKEDVVDSLRARSKKPKKREAHIHIEKIVEKEKEEIQKKKLLEDAEYYNYFGIELRKDEMIKLKSKMDFSNCTLYVLEDNDVQLLFIGEESVATLSRGTTFWLYLDHTTDKKYITELQKHVS